MWLLKAKKKRKEKMAQVQATNRKEHGAYEAQKNEHKPRTEKCTKREKMTIEPLIGLERRC